MRAVALSGLLLLAQAPPDAQRSDMVREQIAARGIRHAGVLKAMRETPRHLFMPESVRDQAYADRPVPIGYSATISQPYIVGAMSELLEPAANHSVLEIGTGSGYQAAILSPLVKHVWTIEIVAELARSATETLGRLGYRNVTVRHGDGYLGWPEKAPFDRIILTAAPPEIPQALLDQLRAPGKLVAPVGRNPVDQELVVVDKSADGKLRRRAVFPVRFVPMVRK